MQSFLKTYVKCIFILKDLVDDDTVDKYSPENEGKVSSSSQRMRLLGIELKAPEKKWICSAGPYVIGLTGGSCSGKTNISKYLGK